MKSYTFYKDGQEVRTDNLAAFCKEHGLQRRHVYEVVDGKRRSYKGFSRAAEEETYPVSVAFDMAEVAAQAMIAEGNPHGYKVLDSIERVKRGEKIKVVVGDELSEEIERLRQVGAVE